MPADNQGRRGTPVAGVITGSIVPIYSRPPTVLWEMTADEARDLARWMRDVLHPSDSARRDADALDLAADAIDPPREDG